MYKIYANFYDGNKDAESIDEYVASCKYPINYESMDEAMHIYNRWLSNIEAIDKNFLRRDKMYPDSEAPIMMILGIWDTNEKKFVEFTRCPVTPIKTQKEKNND